MMSNEDGLQVIRNCLKPDNQGIDDQYDRDTSRYVTSLNEDGKTIWTVTDGTVYLASISIISMHTSAKSSPGDYASESEVVFSCDKGYGIARQSSWADYTFNGEDYSITLMETLTPEKFWMMVLTDEQRERHHSFAVEAFLLEAK